MTRVTANLGYLRYILGIALATFLPTLVVAELPRADLLNIANGAIPVGVEGRANELKVGIREALQVIDGDGSGFVLTPKPGDMNTAITFIYELPALTTFETFAVPNVLETPSPSQTFVKTISIAGSETGRDGPFDKIAELTLEKHPKKNETTSAPAATKKPVRWVRVTLGGGINIERDKTFFEFSEIEGYGIQEQVPLSLAFSGKWKGRGVKLELKQDGVRVSGCYDQDGELDGTVNGNILYATGRTRQGGIASTFVLSVSSDNEIIGVRSTNGAPFKLYNGFTAPNLITQCSERSVTQIGCGSVVHGIHFDFDSAIIRSESNEYLDALYDGLRESTATSVTIIGHTSSEGSEEYNEKLSQRRAEAVVAAIVARGIEAERISAQGQGEKHPIADNSSEAGRSLNRRVEIECH